jgi:TolB protein
MNMKGQRKVTSNFDGLNMQPCFSPDGTKVVYCASRGQGNCDLYYCDNTKAFKRLTKNNGNNIAPTFADNGKTLYFCSDFETHIPQLYRYNLESKKITRISNGGYCASPSYCQENGLLAYLKKVCGIMQLFVYDACLNTHMQLTTSPESKDECSWSPCGNYIVFSKQNGCKSMLAQFNRLTNTEYSIGTVASNCSYPTWSPWYQSTAVTS